MGKVKHIENGVGPNVVQAGRLAVVQRELYGLVARRDEIGELLTDVKHPEWEARMREYNILGSRIASAKKRQGNIMKNRPELGIRADYYHLVLTKPTR